ncbi:MAG: HNH endonuclease family protein [Bdellovibrionaceae bacterium]|nr:HNH endonuclease family protein [Pseudobdellovibrionaceae bacterium]
MTRPFLPNACRALVFVLISSLSAGALAATSQPSRQTTAKTYSLLRWLQGQAKRESVLFERIPPYDRIQHFGSWINEDSPSDCYDTRAEALLRDAEPNVEVKFYRDNACKVRSGAWYDPYTNRIFKTSHSLQIDHVVPLKNAYMTGAWRWSRPARCHYANYVGNAYHLMTVHGHENMSKNSQDPSGYLPPNRAFLCEYVRSWMKIKLIWGLAVTAEEDQGIRRALQLGRCNPDEQVISEAELREQRRRAAQISAACLRQGSSAPSRTKGRVSEGTDRWADFMDLDDPELRRSLGIH